VNIKLNDSWIPTWEWVGFSFIKLLGGECSSLWS